MKLRNMGKKFGVSLIASSIVLVGTANAALTADQVNAIRDVVLADAGLVIGAAFALIAVILSADVGIGLVKKFVKKGAR